MKLWLITLPRKYSSLLKHLGLESCLKISSPEQSVPMLFVLARISLDKPDLELCHLYKF